MENLTRLHSTATHRTADEESAQGIQIPSANRLSDFSRELGA